ncbi:MAG: DoxX family protein [Proteobacteria bacterium]|nr:DoxX family protein [Pseudomonadota bacterium]
MRGVSVTAVAELAGRVLLALLFILEGAGKINAYNNAVAYMTAFQVPWQLLPPAIALELGAGVLVIVGWHARVAAAALAVFCALAAVIFHANFAERGQVLHFEKDMALAGAFLILYARGAGALSIDALRSSTAVKA